MPFKQRAKTRKNLGHFQTLRERAKQAMAAELTREAEQTITEAKIETPVEFGNLRASGHVEAPTFKGDRVEVRCGFGGAAIEYALIVHENLENHHPVGKAKYLEDPFNRRIKGLPERVAAGIKQRLGI